MNRRKAAGSALAVLFWLVLWQLGAAAVNRELLLPIPTPFSTLAAMIRLSMLDSFRLAAAASLLRICAGFAAALLLGTVCAFTASRCELFRVLTAPLLQLIRAVPVASLTIVVFLWISRDSIPSVIVFITVFPIIWANVENGARTVDRNLVEMAAVFGMSRLRILKEIVLPGIRPFFVSAAASGLGFAWKSGVAAEVICRTANSVGSLLWASKTAIDYDEVFAETLVIILLSTLLQRLAVLLMNRGGQNDKA